MKRTKRVKHIRFFLFIVFFMAGLEFVFGQPEKENLNIFDNWIEWTDGKNMLIHHLNKQSFEYLDLREKEIADLKTKQDWINRQKKVKDILMNTIGPLPDKGPLNAKITGILKKDGYRVENITYESIPGFYVTASLFIPNNIRKPTPAILFCSGHSTDAYRKLTYQIPLLNLVKKGFIVLAIDPIGQGERLQYFNPQKGASTIGSSSVEHSYLSVQVFLTGKSIATYFAWDGIRGIDYLVSRKEVDPKRIGVHGLSGGGTQTAFISALDERVAASAPAAFITSYRRLMESVGVQDGEQNLYHGISNGIDHADLIEIRAPKPTLIMATTGDFFSIQGSRETYSEVKRIYEIFGKPDNVEITEDDFGHGYTKKNREALYAFFQKHLQLPGSSEEEVVGPLLPQELQVTLTGQLSTSLGGETVFSINRKETENLIGDLQASRIDLKRHLPVVLSAAKKLSGFQEPLQVIEPVFTGRIQREGYGIEKYFVKGEGGYVIPYLLMIPDLPNKKVILYLHPKGKSAEASVGGEMEWFVKKGFTVLAPDMIGVGEMGPGDFKGDSYIGGVSYNTWFSSLLIGRSIVGIQAGDVVRLSRLMSKKCGISEVYGFARTEMAPVMLHAAAFEPSITRIALVEPYSSYRSMVMNLVYNPLFVQSTVPGALKAYDLPDLAATLAPRKLLMTGVTDGNGKNLDADGINSDLAIIRNAYHYRNAEGQLNIVADKPNEKLYDFFREWINE